MPQRRTMAMAAEQHEEWLDGTRYLDMRPSPTSTKPNSHSPLNLYQLRSP